MRPTLDLGGTAELLCSVLSLLSQFSVSSLDGLGGTNLFRTKESKISRCPQVMLIQMREGWR